MKCSRIGQKMKIKGIKDILGFFLLLISLFLLGKMIRFCLSPDIWYDEVFSTKMISGSFKEITRFTARDVHPPFYYWYLKVFVQAGRMILGTLTRESTVILAKLASTLPLAGLWILAATKMRKQFGPFTAGVFIFCVYTMPQLTAYGMEIRMYSLALFLVTLAFLFAYDASVTKKTAAFVGLFFSGILVAYTHYFSCLGIAFLYLLLGWIIRKDRDGMKKWLLCGSAFVFAYLPWLGTLIRQFFQVRGSYWIPPLTWKSFAGCIKYIYLPSGGYPWLNYTLAVLLILTTLVLAGLFWRKQGVSGLESAKEKEAICLSWGMLAGVILVGVGISIRVSPVFVYRYMIPFLGSFWFVFAFLLDRSDKRTVWITAWLLTFLVGCINVRGVFWEENNKQEHMADTMAGLGQIQEEDILVFNFNHVQAVVGYYLQNSRYLLYQEPEQLIQEIYGNFHMLKDAAGLENILAEQTEGSVWSLGSFHSREEIVEQWRNLGLTVTEEGSFLLERYWFNLYRIEKKY